MKKSVKLVSSLIVILFTMVTVFAGCGTKSEETSAGQTTAQAPAAQSTAATAAATTAADPGLDTSKPVDLIMYLVGDPCIDQEKVYDEVNKKLKADLNTTVQPKYLAWADFATKYSLIFASGEDFDLIYTADWAYYAQQATKNAFREVKQEDVQKYAPEYYAKIPSDFWPQLKIGGKGYMMPYLNKQVEGHAMVMTRGDLREKYSLPEIKTTADLDNYMLTIAKNEKTFKCMDGKVDDVRALIEQVYYKQPNNLMFVKNTPMLTVKLDDTTGKISSAYDDPAFLDALKHSKELADAGVWSKSVLTNKIASNENLKAGKSALYINNPEASISFTNETLVAHPEWKPEANDVSSDKIHESSSAARSGMGFNANTKNYERALMMLNLFGTRKDYYDLTTYGIEGVHYNPVGEKKLESLPDGVKNFPPKTNCPWGWENKEFMRFPQNVPDSIIGLEAGWISNGLASTTPLVSFNFDDSSVKNEMAACNNLISIEGYALICGQFKDPASELDKLKANLKSAGYDKIIAECQKQVTDFIANANK